MLIISEPLHNKLYHQNDTGTWKSKFTLLCWADQDDINILRNLRRTQAIILLANIRGPYRSHSKSRNYYDLKGKHIDV